MIRNSKWHSLFRVKDSPILYENIDPIGKEFDTYKIGTTANSCSTMHKITSKPITLESFEIDDLIVWDEADNLCKYYSNGENFAEMISLIDWLENLRLSYLEWKEKEKNAQDKEEQERCEHNAYLVWKELIRWLPEGWLQKRTVTMTYENLHAICSKSQRYFHKLNEWSGRRNSKLENFIKWVREKIPYAEDFILYHEIEDEKKQEEKILELATYYLEGFLEANMMYKEKNPLRIPSQFKTITEETWNQIAKAKIGNHYRWLSSKEPVGIKCYIEDEYLMVQLERKKNEEA